MALWKQPPDRDRLNASGRNTLLEQLGITSEDGSLACIARLTMAVVPRRAVMAG